MLNEVRKKRLHKCGLCNRDIKSPEPYVFAHILSKGMYPKYRYNSNNVMLVCSIEHHGLLDKHTAGIKYWLENLIKNNIMITFNHINQLHNDTT